MLRVPDIVCYNVIDQISIYTILDRAIGMPVNEFNESKDLEVMTFRRDILNICKSAAEERERGPLSQALYVYPPDIDSNPELPEHIQEALSSTVSFHNFACYHHDQPR